MIRITGTVQGFGGTLAADAELGHPVEGAEVKFSPVGDPWRVQAGVLTVTRGHVGRTDAVGVVRGADGEPGVLLPENRLWDVTITATGYPLWRGRMWFDGSRDLADARLVPPETPVVFLETEAGVLPAEPEPGSLWINPETWVISEWSGTWVEIGMLSGVTDGLVAGLIDGDTGTRTRIREAVAVEAAEVYDSRLDAARQSLVESVETLVAGVPRSHARTVGGPSVVWRFDDGYLNNLEVAAPILAQHGFYGVQYGGTDSTWLGSIRNGHQIHQVEHMVELVERYGWELGSHTRTHAAWGQVSEADWITSLEASIHDMELYGLPTPTSFAYPNGMRASESDRIVFRRFDNAGLAGLPGRSPTRWDQPTFFHGWAEIYSTPDVVREHVERAKRYVRTQMERGQHAILGFHAITPGSATPSHFFHTQEDVFREIVEWVAKQGYGCATPRDFVRRNRLADPTFRQEVTPSSMPWRARADGFVRTDKAFAKRMTLDTGSMVYGTSRIRDIEQEVPVSPGEVLRCEAVIDVESVMTGGVTCEVIWLSPLDANLGGSLVGRASSVGEQVLRATLTVPDGVTGARFRVRNNADDQGGFQGRAHVSWASMEDAKLVDLFA